jgi:protein arginine kinase
MINGDLDKLIKNKLSWLASGESENSIAISSRIRLARNLQGVSFPNTATEVELNTVLNSVQNSIDGLETANDVYIFYPDMLLAIERNLLLERGLISHEFLANSRSRALILFEGERNSIMINEEDHLRLQTILPGFKLKEAWNEIDKMDTHINTQLHYAYNNKLGYLTSSPGNVGTGLRASVMLHLPGLVLSEQIDAVIHGVHKLGLMVKGFLGEGTKNLGNLYQVSNQSSLGETEEQIIERIEQTVAQIINHEKNSRYQLFEQDQNFLLNHIGRAYGILRHAYTISTKETLYSLSALRMGVDFGMFSSIDTQTINELFITIHPAHLQRKFNKELKTSQERDIYRATLIREKLSHSEKK